MPFTLTAEEMEIIRRYRDHKKRVASSFYPTPREALTAILLECGCELDIIERDLRAEARRGQEAEPHAPLPL